MAVRLLSNQNVNGDIDVNHSQNAITYVAVTNTNTGVAANSRVQVVGESSQLDLIATSAGYTGVTGWADAGIITTDSGASGGLKLNSQAGGIQLQIGTTSHFYLATTGNVGINDAGAAATSLSVKDTQDTAFTSGISVIRSANSDVGYINMVGGAFNLNSTKNTKLRVSDVTKLEIKSNGINVIGKTETDTLLSTGAAQFDTTAQIGSDTTATPELLTVQAYSHNEAFSGKSSATNYIWFLRNENASGRFQLFNSSGAETIEFTGADGAATFAGNVLLNGYLSVEGTTGNTGGATDRWIGGDGTAGTWFYNVPTGSSHLFGINNSNVLTLNGTGATFAGNVAINGLTNSDYDADADNLVLGATSGNTGITIRSGSSAGNYGSIYFADGTSGTALKAGYIRYEQNTSKMTIGINAVEKIAIALNGDTTFAGNVEFDKNVWQDISTNGGYIMRPNGADYVTTTGAVTGAIEIRIPTGGAGKDDMIKFVVDIYDYATQESITVFIGGYIYQAIGGTTWTNVSAQIIATDSSKNYKVRFGDNGSVHCVWIGETDSTWSYPQILVRDFYGGFATTVEDYLAAWDITYVTSFTTVSNTLTNNFPMSHGGTDDAFWSASGANIYNDNSGNVGIGTTSPGSKLHVKGDFVSIEDPSGGFKMELSADADPVTIMSDNLTGAAYGQIAFVAGNGSGSNDQERMRIDSSGNVGIGIATPSKLLHLYGADATVQIQGLGTGSDAGVNFFPRDGSNVAHLQSIKGVDSSLTFLTGGNSGNSYVPTERMRITSGGKVIVGTDSSNALEVFSSGDTEIGFSYATKGNVYSKIIGDITVASPLAGELAFQTASGGSLSERMRIASDGNIGIGTNAPDEKLDVAGKVQVTGVSLTVLNASDPALTVSDTDTNYRGSMRFNTTDNTLEFFTRFAGTYYTNNLVLKQGNVGIGTNSPETLLHVSGSFDPDDGLGYALIQNTSTGGSSLENAGINVKNHRGTSQFMQWEGNGLRIGSRILTNSGVGDVYFTAGADSVKMVVKANGNVGIGTTSPSAALDIAASVTTSNIGAAIFHEESTNAYSSGGFNSRPTYTLYGINTANTYVGTRLSHAGNTEFFQGIVKGAANGEMTYVWQGYNGTGYQQFGAIDCYGTGAGTLTMAGDVVAYSDKKLKKNIKTLDGSKVYDMRGVSFTRKDTGKESSGVIAQEIQKIAPELVNNTDGTLGVAYGNLTGYLIEAIKELKAEIEELKKNK